MRIDHIEWPEDVKEKVEGRHGLATEEVESAILDRRSHIKKAGRDRYLLLGHSRSGAHVAIVFGYQRRVARIITARRMDLKERRIYRRMKR